MSILSLETILLVCVSQIDAFRPRAFTNKDQEVNMANNTEAYTQGKHPGYEETAWEGLQQTIDVIAEKRIKVAINGGALNPEGLGLRVAGLVGNPPYCMNWEITN